MKLHFRIVLISCGICSIFLNALFLGLYAPDFESLQECKVLIRDLKRTISQLKTSPPSLSPSHHHDNDDNFINTIHIITPTYERWTQKADLTRLCQTLMHITKLHWLVIEDSYHKTDLVKRFLKRCPVNSTHLNVRTKQELQRNEGEPVWRKSRGVEQRNLGIKWLRDNFKSSTTDVVYFGDDDNTYDIELFKEIRKTQKLSVWPVGICGGLKWEGPVCEGGKVRSWHTSWAKKRSFPIDFAGFAIRLDVLLEHPNVNINPDSHIGWLESDFLTPMVNPQETEGRADNCMKVLVWHTRTEKPKTKDEDKLIKKGIPSNPDIEV